MRGALLVWFLSLLACGSVQAQTAIQAATQTATIERVDITDRGIYEGKISGAASAPSLTSGVLELFNGLKLKNSATDIPAKFGTIFGYRYTLVGAPRGATVQLRFVTIYPVGGLRNPDQGSDVKGGGEVIERATVGATGWDGYLLNHAWELVPGVWTFQIWYQKRKLSEQSFTLSID